MDNGVTESRYSIQTSIIKLLNIIFVIQGSRSIYFTVFRSSLLPVHTTWVERSETFYQNHAGEKLLKVRQQKNGIVDIKQLLIKHTLII